MTTRRRQTGQANRDSHQSKRAGTARTAAKSPNEGEGSRSAARDYNERTKQFIDSGRVDQSADAAEHAIESGEREKLEEAERIGRQHRKS